MEVSWFPRQIALVWTPVQILTSTNEPVGTRRYSANRGDFAVSACRQRRIQRNFEGTALFSGSVAVSHLSDADANSEVDRQLRKVSSKAVEAPEKHSRTAEQ